MREMSSMSLEEMLQVGIQFEALSQQIIGFGKARDPRVGRAVERLLIANAIYHIEQATIGLEYRMKRQKDPEEIKVFKLAMDDVLGGLKTLKERYSDGF